MKHETWNMKRWNFSLFSKLKVASWKFKSFSNFRFWIFDFRFSEKKVSEKKFCFGNKNFERKFECESWSSTGRSTVRQFKCWRLTSTSGSLDVWMSGSLDLSNWDERWIKPRITHIYSYSYSFRWLNWMICLWLMFCFHGTRDHTHNSQLTLTLAIFNLFNR